MSEPPVTFGIDDNSLYAFNKLEKEPYIRDAKSIDMAFHLHITTHESRGWTMFNHKLTSRMHSQTSVGNLPISIAPAHEFDTLNTVVKRYMAISTRFGQEHTIITVDQGLYCKLMELKWAISDYQDKSDSSFRGATYLN